MEIHPAALAAWVPDFVRVSNTLSGILRDPTSEEIAAHRGLFAANVLRVENLEMFVEHVASGARLRSEPDVGVDDDGLLFRVEPRNDLATIVAAARTFAAPPQRLYRLYTLLHPFTDGNARSGRALLLWQVIRSTERGADVTHALDRAPPALRAAAARASARPPH